MISLRHHILVSLIGVHPNGTRTQINPISLGWICCFCFFAFLSLSFSFLVLNYKIRTFQVWFGSGFVSWINGSNPRLPIYSKYFLYIVSIIVKISKHIFKVLKSVEFMLIIRAIYGQMHSNPKTYPIKPEHTGIGLDHF